MTNIIIYILGASMSFLVIVIAGLFLLYRFAKDRHNVNIFEGFFEFKFWKKGK